MMDVQPRQYNVRFHHRMEKDTVASDSSIQTEFQHKISSCNNPSSPRMRSLANRYSTFSNWPNHIAATPQELADSGFMYLGSRDKVKCFYCNGGLQDWLYDEEPWYEHAKWYPNCEYLLMKKGYEYVQSVAGRYPNLKRPTMRNPAPKNRLVNLIPTTSLSVSSSTVRNVEADDATRITSSAPCRKNPDEKVEEAMTKVVVKEAISFAFDIDIIRKVVRRKLETSNSEYTSVMSLVEDIQIEEETSSNALSLSDQPEPVAMEITYDAIESDSAPPVPATTSHQTAGLLLMEDLPQQQPRMAKVFPRKSPTSLGPDGLNKPSSSPKQPSNDEIDKKLNSLMDEKSCKVCLDEIADCIFFPCNHLCCCVKCASSLSTCPICRSKLQKIIRIYRN